VCGAYNPNMSDDANGIRELVVGGVRTLQIRRPRLTRATLHFGVGLADEEFSTRGVARVIERLALGRTSHSKFEHNASVGRTRCKFWAGGEPEHVAQFFEQLGRALVDLPLDYLARERKILDAEDAEHGFDDHDVLLAARFGNHGLGLGVHPTYGARSTDPATVQAHASQWFVRENALLTIIGRLPEGFDLPLPEGRVPPHIHHDHLLRGPGWMPDGDVRDPALGFVAADRLETIIASRVMAQSLERSLRDELGILYAVEPELVRLPPTGRVVVQLATSATPGSEKVVAEALASELLRRTEIGVTVDELADDLAALDAFLADPGFVEPNLDNEAERALAGLPLLSPGTIRAALSAVTSEGVAAVLRDAVSSALLVVPSGVEPETSFARSLSCGATREMTVPELRRSFRSSAPAGTALGSSEDRVQYRDEAGDVHEIRLRECVGVGFTSRSRLLFGLGGCQIWVDPRRFQAGDTLIRAIDDRVPATLRFPLG